MAYISRKNYNIKKICAELKVHPESIRRREAGQLKSYPPKYIEGLANQLNATVMLVREPDIRMPFNEVSCRLLYHQLNSDRVVKRGQYRGMQMYRLEDLAEYMNFDRSRLNQSNFVKYVIGLDMLVPFGEFLDQRVYAELTHEFLHDL